MVPLDIFKEHWTVYVLGRITFNQIEDWALEQGFVWNEQSDGGPLETSEVKYLIRFNWFAPGRINISESRKMAAEVAELSVNAGRPVKMFTYHEWRDYIVPAVAEKKAIDQIKNEVNAG